MNRLHLRIQSLPRGVCDWRLAAVLLSLAISGSGCNKEPMGGPRVGVVPITGKVLVDGKPVEGIAVNFFRISERGTDFTFPDPQGISDKNGVLTVSSYTVGDGGAPGEYKLTFEWGRLDPLTGRLSGDKFRGKYLEPDDSKYTVTVPEDVGKEPYDIGTIEISSK